LFGSTLNRSGLEEHADTQFQDYVWAYGAKSYGKQAPIERKVSVVMRWVYAAENYPDQGFVRCKQRIGRYWKYAKPWKV